MANLQRAGWTFLFFTLVGPFLAALAAILILPALIFLQLGPFAGEYWGILNSAHEPTVSKVMSFVAMAAINIYLWSAIPALISGIILALFTAKGWPSGWSFTGITGVIGFMIAAILMPFEHTGLLTYIAFGAGIIAIACQAVLIKASVLQSDRPT